MAIDSQDKRRSAQSYAGALIAPVPDGAALDEADRRAVAGVYRGITSGAGGTLTGTAGAYISPATALYAGFLYGGPIRIENVTHFESGGGESAVSFYHTTPPGENRLLAVVATYKDTAGVNSGAWGSSGTGDGQFNSPQGIATDSGGNVYVTDTSNYRVQKFTSAGVFSAKWGSNGTGDGEFDSPQGIATDSDGKVYVVDSGNRRIQKFTSDGTFVTKWGSSGSGDGQFVGPFGITVDGSGDVYVVDRGNHRIQKFTGAGVFVTKWGSSGVGDGQFIYPHGITLDSARNVYVVDTYNNRIQKFTAGLKLNAAYYAGTAMKVGPLTDSGSYFQALYTMENPPVGSYEVALAAPTGPDVFLLTAISLTGVESAQTDYTGPAAGVAERETSTTALQVSHNRAYPDYTLSLWALLYEGATTLTAAASNFHWLTRTAGTLNNAIGFRYIPTATTSNLTFGATASPAVTPRISAVLHLEAARPQLTGAAGSVIGGATLYAGEIQHEGQTLYGAAGSFITATTTLYGGTLDAALHGVYIAATTTLYAGAFDLEPGPDLFITGFFIGLGQPAALNGAYIDATTALYAGALEMELFLTGEDASYIVSTAALYAGTALEIVTATGFIAAGQIIHV